MSHAFRPRRWVVWVVGTVVHICISDVPDSTLYPRIERWMLEDVVSVRSSGNTLGGDATGRVQDDPDVNGGIYIRRVTRVDGWCLECDRRLLYQ